MTDNKRVLALIDGFNYYHPINNFQKRKNVCVKWLNYYSLILSLLSDEDDKESLKVIYFSALANYRKDGTPERHKIFIKALKKVDVEVILGHFQIKDKPKCWHCKYSSECTPDKTHEEKSTDVNIALTLLEYAFLNKFDKCFILSADNDFATAIKKVKELFPEKKIIICPPPARKYYLDRLTNNGQAEIRYIYWNDIIKNQFPDEFNGLINPWKVEDKESMELLKNE